jgi:hypothetical protein
MVELKGGIKQGAVFMSRNYGLYEVLEVINAVKVKIKFLEPEWEMIVEAGDVRKGNVKNRMKPSIYGVGFIGDGPYQSVLENKQSPAYTVWHDMLKRCYKPYDIYHIRNYVDITVSQEWHNFQNFAPWYHSQIDRFGPVDFVWELDKDLLIPGNTMYTPEACLLVPRMINSLMTSAQHARGKYPLGVYRRGKLYEVACRNCMTGKIHIGTYFTMVEAQNAYWNAKFKAIRDTVIHYWQYLPEPLAYRLLTFGWKEAKDYYGNDAVIWNDL